MLFGIEVSHTVLDIIRYTGYVLVCSGLIIIWLYVLDSKDKKGGDR